MARKDATLLGIDLHEHEIRVVQIKGRANKATITKVGRAPMPAGGIVRGKVMQPASVAIALRLLMNSMDIGSASRAVIGVMGDTTTLRILPVPPVPDSDLSTIVTGEVEHYGIVKTDGGTHAYLRLFPPPRNVEADQDPDPSDVKPVNVTIVALEEDIIVNLREATHEANITIDAIEPTQYGMYRALMVSAAQASSAFGLMINPANTDIAISYKGNLVAYRRVDVGSRAMLLNAQVKSDYGYVDPNRDIFEDDFDKEESYEPELNYQAVDNLSIEVQRTLDYYQREFPTVGIGDRILIAIDDSRLAPLAKELSQRLGVTVEIVQPPTGPGDNTEATTEILSGAGPIYAAAYGLATQGQVLSRVPRIDLFTKERITVQKAETKRNFRGSIVTSLIAILLGGLGYSLYSRQIATLEADIKQKHDQMTLIRQTTDKEKEQRAREAMQFKGLRHEGVPLTAMMDYIANNLNSATGLSQVTVLPDLTVLISGEAVNQQSLITTLETLQHCPVIKDLQTISFNQLPEEAGYGVAFQFRGKTVSIDRLAFPEDVKPAEPTKTTEAPKIVEVGKKK